MSETSNVEGAPAVAVQRVVRCPACGEKMQEPLTAKTCDRKSGPTKWEKLWMCQKDGYLKNGKVTRNPFGEDT